MTLLVRDEQDILADNIWHHYHQGIGQFIVMDNLSTDNTPALIAEISKWIPVEYIPQLDDDYNQAGWVTAMARLAAERFHADWVINNDADEFWFSPEGRLADVIARIPQTVGTVNVRRLNAVPVFRGADPLTSSAHPRETMLFDADSTNSLGGPLPGKCFHRASTGVVVSQGNHAVSGVEGQVVDGSQFVIYHYPYRTYASYANKLSLGGQAYERNQRLPQEMGVTWRQGYLDLQAGRLKEFWERVSFDEPASEFQRLRGRFVSDTSMTQAVLAADRTRAQLIRAAAHRDLSAATRTFLRERDLELVSQLDAFSESERSRRPLYRNIAFFQSGRRRHAEQIVELGREPGCRIEFDDFRDLVSLAPANRATRDFATAALLAENPVAARQLRGDIQGKDVILHISCEKYLDRARRSWESFADLDSEVVHLVALGRSGVGLSPAPGWGFTYQDGIVTLPVPDSYEKLHQKVFHALFLLSRLGLARSVTKIDDSLHLHDGDQFLRTLASAVTAEPPCTGRVVGTRRHDFQLHGWHVGKCSDQDMDQRGYSYPLPRRYPAGGYGYVLKPAGVDACADMYLSMKEFFNIQAVGLEDAYVGHALYAADLEIRDVWSDASLLALPGLDTVE